ncbi:hypothetical protein K32_48840 [Kaistia sp. 32K]|uniref:hypothetical protein n=1 Tax=Kaistia sp. 32K TaxID=2795690 RepID=UPI001914EBD5|nr:hypothetical protein [Kaistia sp. 32K]BCP56267.1 hypothetical protein K32_48840 [Kaistia sp. 32K]
MICQQPQAHPARCGCERVSILRDTNVGYAAGTSRLQSGFEDDDLPSICRHPGHNPPTGLHVPEGKRYRHVCPGCGFTAILRSQGLTMMADRRPISLPKIDISLSAGISDAFCEGVLYAQRMDREALAAAGFEVAP